MFIIPQGNLFVFQRVTIKTKIVRRYSLSIKIGSLLPTVTK